MSGASNPAGGPPDVLLRLYVVGNSPNSLQALADLHAICYQYLSGQPHTVEIVDVLDDPLRALRDGIPATPALVKVSPPPVQSVLGDLSDHAGVARQLGLIP